VVPHDPPADEKAPRNTRPWSSALQKGDEVLTNGGIAGRITKLGETYIGAEIAENVEISGRRTPSRPSCPRAP
jgi:preprotein translocase subunit YajC